VLRVLRVLGTFAEALRRRFKPDSQKKRDMVNSYLIAASRGNKVGKDSAFKIQCDLGGIICSMGRLHWLTIPESRFPDEASTKTQGR
jgi:hypothetical protein